MQHREVRALRQAWNGEDRGSRPWQSDAPVVAEKSGNADGAKGRKGKKMCEGDMCPIKAGVGMETKLTHFIRWAREEPQREYTSLLGKVFDPDVLRASFGALAGNKAPGVDGMRKSDYEVGLEDRITDLSARLRRMGYRPQAVRRVYIPKLTGGRRPLGIPSFEDRLVQNVMKDILQAIWEPEFLGCSYGFRPNRSAHDALKRVGEILFKERTQYVVEADIKGFFNHVHHEHLMRFVNHRIKDPNFLRLIRRFLKAGVFEDGAFSAGEEGTPQGGLISPVLSNLYLHYVLDLWFEKRFVKGCKGKAYLCRYADDFCGCFEREDDAQMFLMEVQKRLADFALEVEPSKTRLIPFGSRMLTRPAAEHRTFNFLGFTHFVTRTRKGGFKVGRRTEGRRFRTKLKALSGKLRAMRTKGGAAMVRFVRQHLTGHMQYYGVSENGGQVSDYFYHAARLLFKWLNRRSQRPSLNWEAFGQRIQPLLPRPRLQHSFYVVSSS